jgi:hypothetical protein
VNVPSARNTRQKTIVHTMNNTSQWWSNAITDMPRNRKTVPSHAALHTHNVNACKNVSAVTHVIILTRYLIVVRACGPTFTTTYCFIHIPQKTILC